MTTAILKNAPTGFPGDVSRLQDSIVEPIMMGSQFSGFGLPFKYNGAGKAVPIAAADTAAAFRGILTRMVPSISGNNNQGFDDSIPNLESAQGALKFGYGLVNCKVGTPVRGGVVYMRVVEALPKLVGDFEATADSTNSVALTQCEWATNGKDANGTAEIRIKNA